MPGTFQTIYVVAFDLDARNQAMAAFAPRIAADQESAVAEATRLASCHAGALVWRRRNDPAVGEEGEPEIVYSVGKIGDFD